MEYVCGYCCEAFTDKRKWLKHMKECQGIYRDLEIGKKMLEEHIKLMTGKLSEE